MNQLNKSYNFTQRYNCIISEGRQQTKDMLHNNQTVITLHYFIIILNRIWVTEPAMYIFMKYQI